MYDGLARPDGAAGGVAVAMADGVVVATVR